jgi:hypothetical protein
VLPISVATRNFLFISLSINGNADKVREKATMSGNRYMYRLTIRMKIVALKKILSSHQISDHSLSVFLQHSILCQIIIVK